MTNTVIMPQLGETVAEGKILTWFKSVGDEIKEGDNLWLFGLLCGRILVASGWRRPIRRGKARFDCAPKMGRFSAWMNPCPNRRFWMAIAFPDFGFARGSSSMSAIQPAW